MDGPIVALLVALVAGVAAWSVDRRRRRYADLPTSSAAAVFAGRNEVKGRAWASEPLTSHGTATSTVWWEYCLEEEREHTRTVTSTDSNGRSQTRTERYRQWHVVERRSDALTVFEVVDDTGSVPVRLEKATVVPRELCNRVFRAADGRGFLAKVFDDRTGRYRESERAVPVGDDLFVVGEAELDPGTNVPALARDVLVSTRSEESHRRGLGVAVVALALVSGAATIATSVLLIDPGEPTRPVAWLPGLVAAASALVVVWAVIVYNRLRLVAESAERAWSLIDVQLQRRHDLVPALSRAVSAHASHEAEALGAISLGRRSTGTETAAAELSDEAADQTGVLRDLLAVAERYPQLRADEAYLGLQRELADSEARIAATRTFYNDSITLLRDRASMFPGVLVARHLTLSQRDLISAVGFERTVPPVHHDFV